MPLCLILSVRPIDHFVNHGVPIYKKLIENLLIPVRSHDRNVLIDPNLMGIILYYFEWKLCRATFILLPLLGLHYVVMPFRPEPGSAGEIAYQIVSAVFTSFQVSCTIKNNIG
jgi:7 transmembrane receptor (Secretin family)